MVHKFPLTIEGTIWQNCHMKINLTHVLLSVLLLMACEGKNSSQNGIETNNSSVSGPTDGPSSSSFTDEFMDLVNAHRAHLGLRALIQSEDLSEIAQKHSVDMASGEVPFGHDGFSSRCSQAKRAMGNSNACAENVAWGQKTPQAVFNSWINSTGHKANIEKAAYTHSGLGIQKDSKGSLYWTHLFLEVR